MNADPQTDFDGCYRKCRVEQRHTMEYGGCEYADKPEPTVSMSKVYTDPEDGYPSIGFDTYTVDQLAELLDPVLGFEAMRAREGSVDLSHLAAHTIVHRNDPAAPAAARVVSAAPDQANLRQRIAQAIDRVTGGTCPGDILDAVLSVLPPPADRAAWFAVDRVTRWEAAARAAGREVDRNALRAYMAVADAEQAELRRMADEAQQPETDDTDLTGQTTDQTAEPVCICGHPQGRHFEDACVTEVTGEERPCDCGDFLTGEAAREVIARWRDAAIQARADRAAILTEAADEAEAVAESLRKHHEFERSTGALDVMTELRRLADETQPTTETCGRTRSISGTEYPPCARTAGHGEAYCRSADDNAYFLAVNADQPTTQTPVGYGDGKGRVFCTACPRPADPVPLTAEDVDHWELCPSCGRHVVDVARAAGARQDGVQQ